jgi:hypothetical protein
MNAAPWSRRRAIDSVAVGFRPRTASFRGRSEGDVAVRLLVLRRALTLVVVLTLIAPQLVSGTVWTDQADYSPGSVVTISGDNSDGAGYLPGETVDVNVFGPNGYAASCSAVTDEHGAWSCQVTLWDTELAVGDYTYTATGRDSQVSENGAFTDAWGTATVLASSPNPSIVGQSVTFTATVTYSGSGSGSGSPTSGSAVTTGTVLFGTGANCGGGFTAFSPQTGQTPNASGVVTFATSFPTSGDRTVRACYTGTGGQGTGNSNASLTQVVNAAPADSTPPDTFITANPTNPTNSSSASFSFTGTDNVTPSGSLTFQCQLDGGSFAACTSPQNFTGLADGSHTFQVRAIDGAAIVDPTPASYTWTIDTIAPDTTIDAAPSNPSNSSSASFAFSGTDGGTGVASFECKLDGGTFAACTSPQNHTGLGDGSHTFQVRAVDGAGHVDPTPASYTWMIDTVDPVITATATKADSSSYVADTWTNQNVTVVFTCSDDSGQLSVDAVADDGGTWMTESAIGAFTAPGSDCVDAAGNQAVSVTFSPIKVDKTAPVITDLGPTTSANANGWYNADVTNRFQATDNLSGLDASCLTAFPDVSGDRIQSKTTTGEGTALTVTSDGCTDLAGNTAAGKVSAEFKVDKTAPTSVAFGPHGLTEGESYDFGFVPSGPTTCSADYDISGDAGCVVSGYSTSVGAHTVQAAATDNAGNTGYAYLNYSVLAWTLTGFHKPVDMGLVNTVKGGSTVPLKFEVFAGSLELTSTSFIGAIFKTRQVSCNEFGNVLYDDVEITTTGGTSFRYDVESGQFIQNWQTPKKPGTCWVTTMTTADGSFLAASFKLK